MDFKTLPGQFYLGNVFRVMPYYSNIDNSRGVGEIKYEVHTLASVSSFLVDVSTFIRKETGSLFSGKWMLLAEWRNIPHYISPTQHMVCV